MRRLSATARIAFSLACLSVTVVFLAHSLGLIPDERAAVLKGRSSLCETIAINYSLLAARGDVVAMEHGLQAIAQRNEDILSIAIRGSDKELLLDVGKHVQHWRNSSQEGSTETQMYVPIMAGTEQWGTVEICFRPTTAPGFFNYANQPILPLGIFVGGSCLLTYYFYLRKVLQQLNPSKAVPPRVRRALDSLAEGLLVLDQNERIVLANESFAAKIGRHADALLGSHASELPWVNVDQENPNQPKPWSEVIRDGRALTGVLMGLETKGDGPRTFLVNSTPVQDDKGKQRGVLTSFEDVTPLEKKKAELSEMLDSLRESSEEIGRQNRELERLATIDPLTSCYNRRAFFEQFETQWCNASRYEFPLSCLMVDIDHFKLINDEHGHATGDEVLRKVAGVLRAAARDGDVVCRYGGEEFAILLPHITIDDAAHAAERFRAAIEATEFSNLSVTASLGLSAVCQGAHDPQALLEQADKCLYVAKRSGRNQVARWDDVPEDAEFAESTTTEADGAASSTAEVSIPFQAVTALISALAYRDLQTAEHSRRVADLCVAAAEGLMPLSDCYVLEIAALLHDIGKVGVPDSILSKPDVLDDQEWEVMRRHKRMGAEIIQASFRSEKLTAIVEDYSTPFDGKDVNGAKERYLPLGARVLSIVDAYDSMTTDHVYRQGRSRKEAFAELRRCAGKQFDPELVERFIQTVETRNRQSGPTPVIAKEAALSIGLQMERLSNALDDQDIQALQSMATRLKLTSANYGIAEIVTQASALEDALEYDEDLIGVLQTAHDLMELCRSAQRAYVCVAANAGASAGVDQ